VLLVLPALYAHVAPSPDADNRYLKITLLPDHARIAYLVFFGERPGARARVRMDRDHDGVLGPEEARAFGEAVRDEVGPRVALEADGVPVSASWEVADVGLGSPSVHGGAFSVDLVAKVPLRHGVAAHTLWVADRFRPPVPGEVEWLLEPAPDVTLDAAFPGRQGRGLQTRYADPSGAALEVTAHFTAPIIPAPVSRTPRPWLWLALITAALALSLYIARRRRSPPVA
jgi:hypothetical protein